VEDGLVGLPRDGSGIARYRLGLAITLAGIACIIMREVYATIREEHIPEPKLPE